MKFYMAVDLFCPKCGQIIDVTLRDKQTGDRFVRCQNQQCELSKALFEAPTVELSQKFVKKEETV